MNPHFQHNLYFTHCVHTNKFYIITYISHAWFKTILGPSCCWVNIGFIYIPHNILTTIMYKLGPWYSWVGKATLLRNRLSSENVKVQNKGSNRSVQKLLLCYYVFTSPFLHRKLTLFLTLHGVAFSEHNLCGTLWSWPMEAYLLSV